MFIRSDLMLLKQIRVKNVTMLNAHKKPLEFLVLLTSQP